MNSFQRILSSASALLLMIGTASAQSDRTRDFVSNGDARIEVIAEGAGPLGVSLPSRGRDSEEFAAGRATKQSEWWPGGKAPLLDLQAALDPFKPRAMMNEMKEEFGDRITVAVIPDASHALIPEQPAAVVDAIVAWMRKLPR